MTTPDIPPTPERFFDTLQSYQRTAALRSAIELDVFTAIDGGAHDAAAIAAATHASPRGIRMLCDFLTVLGFLQKDTRGYVLTPDSAAFLSKRSRMYLGGMTEFILSPEIVNNFANLTETVRRGTITESQSTVSTENPVWQKFARAMAPMMFPIAQAIADILEVPSTGRMRILDIAAGHGLFGLTLAQRNADADVVAVDWKGVLQVASENAARMGVGPRFKALPGDAFTADWGSGYDVALVTNFLHHFDRATNVRLLSRIADAVNPGGRVVVLEFVPFDDRVSPPAPASFVMNMLAGTPAGDAYTYAELSDMLIDAGLRDPEEHRLPFPQTVIVATKATT